MKSCTLCSVKTRAFFFAAVLLSALGCSGSEAKNQGEPQDRTVCVPANTYFPAAFSPDNKLLIVAFGPGRRTPISANLPQQRAMRLWEVETGKLLHTFWLDEPAMDVFFFDGGKKILASDYASVKIFDVASGTLDG